MEGRSLHARIVRTHEQLSVCLSVSQSICLSVSQSVCMSVCQSVCMSVCLSVSLYVCLSVCLSVSLYVCLSVCQSISQSVCLSLCLSVCLYVCLSVCLSACLSATKPVTLDLKWYLMMSMTTMTTMQSCLWRLQTGVLAVVSNIKLTSGCGVRKGLIARLQKATFKSWSPKPRVVPMVSSRRA